MYHGIVAYPVWGKSTRVDIDMNGMIEKEKGEFTWTYHVWTHYIFEGKTYAIDCCPSLCNIKTDFVSEGVCLDEIKKKENYFKYLTLDKDCEVYSNGQDITRYYK